jgi:NADH-quinone oxidoreductase subunit L
MEHTLQHAAHAAAAQLGPLATHAASYLWLIPFFPLLGAFVNATMGTRLQRRFGKGFVHTISIGAMVLSFAVACVAFVQQLGLDGEHRFLQDTLWNVFTAGKVSVDLGFALDPLSMMMTLIITFIGTLIHVFSTGYMADEPSYWRFFAYLNLFVFSMLLLVMGDNFVLMFFGWEGVGLCSYLLIAFWYTDPLKAAAGMKAFVTNRIGDFGFLLGLFLLFWGLGGTWQKLSDGQLAYVEQAPVAAHAMPEASSPHELLAHAHAPIKVGPTLNFRELRDQVVVESTGVAEHLMSQQIFGYGLLAIVGILLFVGAMGKSAQLPLHVWLPDAMAGPTPVSALIHAATMVTAGVYMVARLNFIFALSPTAMGWVAFIGALTAFFAASIGFFQYDIKKVLAYSTVSQLGFMFIGVGVGAYWAGAYHLLTHAFFKATLFLGSGSVILGCHHEQDMRKMGGLGKLMPVTKWTYLAACWAIAGFPWASGFYSKDEILWKAFSQHDMSFLGVPAPWLGQLIYFMGIVAATGTSFYMFRSYYMTFTGEYRGGNGEGAGHGSPAGTSGPAHPPPQPLATLAPSHGHGHIPHESPLSITLVLITLAVGAVLAAVIGIPMAWTGHAPLLEHWLEPALPAVVEFAEYSHSTEFLFQLIGVMAGVIGWVCARALYKDGTSQVPARLLERWKRAWTVVYNKYYVDELYQATVLRGSVALARACSWFDKNIIDGAVNLAGFVTRVFADIDGVIDRYLVDGAVNLVAGATLSSGRALRRLQTGRIQTYLYGALVGAIALVLINLLIK